MNFKEIRIQSGLSQSKLASLAGINLRSLQDYEQGHKSLASAKGETLFRLSSVLGFTVNDILSGECSHIEFENDDIKELRMKNLSLQYQQALDKKNKQYKFPIIVYDKNVDMSRIYPTKQKKIKKIIDDLRFDSRVFGLWLFGSCITIKCHNKSDIDFAVKLNKPTTKIKNEISEIIQVDCDYNADILWMDRLSKEDKIYNEILRGLVLI